MNSQMAMMRNEQSQSRLHAWCNKVALAVEQASVVTVGLLSGNRNNNDSRAIYRIASGLEEALARKSNRKSMLLCRLNVRKATPISIFSRDDSQIVEPRIEKSVLGSWSKVDLSLEVSNVAPKLLQQVPRWFPKWKLRYNLILVDLGPMHMVPSRVIGRLCDLNVILLGPESSASAQWVAERVQQHEDCGVHIAGTLVSSGTF